VIQVWITRAPGVLTTALPELAAEVLRFAGQVPVVSMDAVLWERWWALAP